MSKDANIGSDSHDRLLKFSRGKMFRITYIGHILNDIDIII